MFRIIGKWLFSIAAFLLIASFLTWIHKALNGGIFLIIVLILLLERYISRVENQLKGLQERNADLEQKCESLSWQVHDLKNKIDDNF